MTEWFEVLFGPELATPIAWIVAALILALVLFIFLKIVRAFTAGTFVSGGRSRRPRLAVVDAAAIDASRRLVLVRRDDVEHLILIGGGADIVVEQDIRMVAARHPIEAEGAHHHDLPARPQPAPVAATPPPRPAAEPSLAPEPSRSEPVPAPEPVRPVSPQQLPRDVQMPEPEPAREARMPAPQREPEPPEPPAAESFPAPPPTAPRPAPQRPPMQRFQFPSRGPAAGTALAASAAATGAAAPGPSEPPPVEFSDVPHVPEPEPAIQPSEAQPEAVQVQRPEPEDWTWQRQPEPARDESEAETGLEPSEDLEPIVELDAPRRGTAAFAPAPAVEPARPERVEPSIDHPAASVPQPASASDLDAALLRELEASLDHTEEPGKDDPADETSLEDEMAKLLGSLSRETR